MVCGRTLFYRYDATPVRLVTYSQTDSRDGSPVTKGVRRRLELRKKKIFFLNKPKTDRDSTTKFFSFLRRRETKATVSAALFDCPARGLSDTRNDGVDLQGVVGIVIVNIYKCIHVYRASIRIAVDLSRTRSRRQHYGGIIITV